MKKKIYIYALLFILPMMFLSGCGYQEIKVLKVKDVTYNELDLVSRKLMIDITATVHNPNFFTVKITDADMVLRLQERVLGNVTQVEQIEIEGRTEKDYTITVAIEMRDLMANAMTLYRIFMNDPTNLNLSGTVNVKSFMYSKTFQVDRLSFQ